MKKFYRNLLLMAAVFFMTLFLSTEASATSLEEQVDLEHLAHYLQQEADAGTIMIDVTEFQIPVEFDLELERAISRILETDRRCYQSVHFGTDVSPYIFWVRVVATERETKKAEAVDALLRGIADNSTLSDLEKALLIHDRLAIWMERTGGTISPSQDFTTSALAERKSHSLGYAQAYQYLLSWVGIRSEVCFSMDALHGWNSAWLDGSCYMVDVYMDDNGYNQADPAVIHDCFLKVDSQNTWRGQQGYSTKYQNISWPARVYLLDDGLYGVKDGDFCRVEETEATPVTVPGVSRPYLLELGLDVSGRLLCYEDRQLYELDIKTGKRTNLWYAEDEITGLDYHRNRVACVVDDKWVYPFEDTAYTVTFKNWDGTVWNTVTCEYGQIITPPKAPDRSGYRFADWEGRKTIICTGDKELTARFTPCQKPNGWFEENGKRYYRENDRKKTGWYQENGKIYHLGITGELKTGVFAVKIPTDTVNEEYQYYYADENGVRQTGWQKEDGVWYYFNSTGEAKTLWGQVGSCWYFFDTSGKMQTGWFYQDDKEYYLDENVGMVIGWKRIATINGNMWHYFGADGDRVEGWRMVNGHWYYLDPISGEMQTGWLKQNGVQYYLREDGAMAVGWQPVGNRWYYFESTGSMVTGWKMIGGKWYYFHTEGVDKGEMATGLWRINGAKYYFGSDGAMRTGWVEYSGSWMYFDRNGAQVTGWLKIGNVWYYFTSEGRMTTNFRTIGGVRYYFDSNGAMRTGWFTVPVAVCDNDGSVKEEKRWYYAEPSGRIYTGWLQQGNIWYYLTESGEMATGYIKVGNQWYHFADNGVWIP